MIAHVSIGVRDIDRSKTFYDAALAPLGYKCIRQENPDRLWARTRQYRVLGRISRATRSG